MTPSVCFIPPRRRQARRVRARVHGWAAACATLAAALAAALGILIAQGRVHEGGVAADLARARAKLEIETQQTKAVEAGIARDERELARIRAIGRHPDWSVLLRTLASERGEHVVLERVTLREGGSQAPGPGQTEASGASDVFTIQLAGQARTQEHATRFTRRLEDLQIFDSVRIIETRLVDVQGREYAAFQVECAVGPKKLAPAPQRAVAAPAGGGVP